MDYVCMAVQKDVAEKAGFGSREEALNYFWERYGSCVIERLEADKRKLEGRIRYYDRREEKYKEDPEIQEECGKRKAAVWEELERIHRQLEGNCDRTNICWDEEKYDLPQEETTKERKLLLRLAGIYRKGSSFLVMEENYYYMKWRISGEGIQKARERIPENIAAGSISLDLCPDSQEAEKRLQKKLKKMMAEALRNFRQEREGNNPAKKC